LDDFACPEKAVSPWFSGLTVIGSRISCNYSRNGVNKPSYIFIF